MNQNSSLWQAWIFDLDDTLLDTSELLIPPSMEKVFQYFVEKKIIQNKEVGLKFWEELRYEFSSHEIIRKFVDIQKTSIDINLEVEKHQLVQEAYQIFRKPFIPSRLEVRPGGLEVLKHIHAEEIKNPLLLFLVTQGDIKSQMQKVEAMQIAPYFRGVYYVDPYSGESKHNAMAEIINKYNLSPAHVLSIGNRLDNEIATGKRLGMQTCFMEYGEHRNSLPMEPNQIPDFKIKTLNELFHLLTDEKLKKV